MSILVQEVRKEHLLLLKHLKFKMKGNDIISSIEIDDELPITEYDKYSYIDLILNGIPADFDPLNTEEMKVYTEEQMDAWDKLYVELAVVLDIILFNGSFETGTYRTKFHDRNWKKVN